MTKPHHRNRVVGHSSNKLLKAISAFAVLIAVFIYVGFVDGEMNFASQRYTLVTQDGRTIELDLKVAQTPMQKSQGLMFVMEMKENQGMIFINEMPTISRFWMKNTHIPLDFLFIDESGKILQTYQDAKPLDEHTHIKSYFPVLYTIELNAGFVKNNGIQIGDRIRLVDAEGDK